MSHILQPNAPRSTAPGGSAGGAGGAQIRCPRCQTPYTAQIINIVDTSVAPQLKSALLSGYLNRTECPNCGAVGVLNVPLVYHDPEKELLLVLLPTELNLNADQQQRLIGGLVQAVMSRVPSEQRKGYFLHPQTVFTMRGLVEKILEADGVTPEMIEAENKRLSLLSDLMQAASNPAQLDRIIEERRGEISYAFFATLVSAAEEAAAAGDEQSSQELIAIRDRLLEEPELAARLPQPLSPDTTLEQALEKLLALADDEQALTAMVAYNRPAFDYVFFQGLTGELEQAQRAGDSARAERLMALRTRMLEEIEQQDQAIQAAQQRDMRIIDEIVSSTDYQAAIRQHLAEIDTLFLNTLGAATQAARREGNIERSARLGQVRQAIVELLAEAMPPELQLINRLMSLDNAEERKAVLAESAGSLNDDLMSLIESLLEELESQGRDETVARLEAIRNEIVAARPAQG